MSGGIIEVKLPKLVEDQLFADQSKAGIFWTLICRSHLIRTRLLNILELSKAKINQFIHHLMYKVNHLLGNPPVVFQRSLPSTANHLTTNIFLRVPILDLSVGLG